MTVLGHLRRSPRLSRSVFAVFVLAWLQTALLPCVMAASLELQAQSTTQSMSEAQQAVMAEMPDCVYCPPDVQSIDAVAAQHACLYPDAPQADSSKSHQLQSEQLTFHPLYFGSFSNFMLEPDVAMPLARRLQPPIPRRPLALTYCVQLK